MKKKFNRIKAVLAEKDKSSLWLAEQIGRDRSTVSRWCTNDMQPPLEVLYQIAAILEVDVCKLLVREEKWRTTWLLVLIWGIWWYVGKSTKPNAQSDNAEVNRKIKQKAAYVFLGEVDLKLEKHYFAKKYFEWVYRCTQNENTRN